MADRIEDASLLTILKDVRVASIEKFNEAVRDNLQEFINEGQGVLNDAATKAIDYAIGTVVGTVYDHPSLYVADLTMKVRPEHNDVEAVASFKPGLAQLYWDEVSS